MTDAAQPPETAANQPAYPIRRILILIAAFAAVLIGYGQIAMNIGQSPAEFAADGDSTLRVAGFAFSIWGVIYAWLIVYAVYQAIPSTTENAALRALGWPSFGALAGIGLWIVASAADWKWGSVFIIAASLLAVLFPLALRPDLWRGLPLKQRALVVWPLALLAGWLSIASVVNLITVLTAQALLPAVLPPAGWAILAVVLTAAIALVVTWRIDQWTYPLPVAWGLFGAFVAERSANIPVAFVCLLGCVAVLLGGLWLTVARPRPKAIEAAVAPDTATLNEPAPAGAISSEPQP